MTKEPVRLLTLATCLALLAGIQINTTITFPTSNVLRILFAASALLVIVVWVRGWHRHRLSARPIPFARSSVPLRNVNALKRRTGYNALFGPDQAFLFADAIANPTAYRERVSEEYHTRHRTLHQKVTIHGRLPIAAETAGPPYGSPAYLPLVLLPKGQLSDDLTVTDSGDQAVPTLSYAEYLELAACALRLLLLAAHGAKRVSDLNPAVVGAESLALRQIIQRVWTDSEEPKGIPEITPLATSNPITYLLDANVSPRNSAMLVAQSMVERLSLNYAIVALVAPLLDGRYILRYRQTLIPRLETTDPGASRIKVILLRSIRFALGAGPVTLKIGIENAATCRSFHLHFHGPEGTYLQAQSAVDFDEAMATQAPKAPTLPHIRFRRRLGQSYAHFYARYFPETESLDQPKIELMFAEVPPGSLFRASVASIALLVICWLASQVNFVNDSDTSVVVLLLVLPAIAAAWMSVQSSSRRLLEGTLRARFSLMLTSVLSLSAAIVYILNTISTTSLAANLPFGISFFQIHDLAWLGIFLGTLINCSYATYKYWLHTYEYAYYSARSDERPVTYVASEGDQS